jgi:hypothetical protein
MSTKKDIEEIFKLLGIKSDLDRKKALLKDLRALEEQKYIPSDYIKISDSTSSKSDEEM